MLCTMNDFYDRAARSNRERGLLIMATELANNLTNHKGKIIEIGNNSVTPLNEERYTLRDYYIFKIRDGMFKETFGLTLVITGEKKTGEQISFSFDCMEFIECFETNPGVIKCNIVTRNRGLDELLEGIEPKTLLLKDNKENEEMIEKYGTQIRRFYLFNEELI